MEVFSVEEFQDRWDELIERVEQGEHIGIVNEDGSSAIMVPHDDPLLDLYTNHDEAS